MLNTVKYYAVKDYFALAVCSILALLQAPFGRDIFDFITETLGRNSHLKISTISALGLALLCVSIRYYRFLLASAAPSIAVKHGLALTGILFLLYWFLVHPSELTHLFSYGGLSLLAYHTFRKREESRPLLMATAYTFAVGVSEEALQGLVPGRFFDLRDIFLNLIGACVGAFFLLPLAPGTSQENTEKLV